MKHAWSDDELAECWTLFPEERDRLANKSGPTRLGFAVLLKFFQNEGRFPRQPLEVPGVVVQALATQTEVAATEWPNYDWMTPLTYAHVNPYGTFRLDMDSRLALDQTEAVIK